jgi:serine/threonine protein kinase
MPDRCLGTDTLCDFLEGRADPDVRRRVEDHASRCARCRELLSSLARSGTPPAAPAPAEADLAAGLAAGTVVGRYVVEHEIGSGGMGVVYAARDPALGRLVAVKVLRGANHPSTGERVRREAQAMARLAHPNVVAVHDVGRFEDRIFVAMEYVAGATLARWSATPRPPHEVLDAYYAAGRGLAAAHAAGIVHRDFKPENVFVGHDGRVRVGDFGVARTVAIGAGYVAVPSSGAAALPIVSDPPAKPDRLTAPGTLLGTPYYIAPELYDGADADARSDQFSFCVALFTALHGKRPFAGDTFTALATNVRAGRIQRARAPGVSRAIHAAIRRGLSADPEARFASLHDLLAELRPAPRRRHARAPVLAAGAALVVGLVAGLVVASLAHC